MDSFGREPAIAPRIPCRSIAARMGFAIDLDCKPRRTTIELKDIIDGRILTAETQTSSVSPKRQPEHDLRRAHLPPPSQSMALARTQALTLSRFTHPPTSP